MSIYGLEKLQELRDTASDDGERSKWQIEIDTYFHPPKKQKQRKKKQKFKITNDDDLWW